MRNLLTKDERVFQFPFNPIFYVWTDRLPASGIFYWVPWMNDYSKAPIKNYPLDLCEQLQKKPPKVISYIDMPIWGVPTDDWMPCLKQFVSNHYFLSTKFPNVWFRDDMALSNPDILNTSFIPEDFNDAALHIKLKRKIDTYKLHYSKLINKESLKCVLKPVEDNGKLRVGNCDDENVLKVSFSKNKQKLYTLQPHQCFDLQIDSNKQNGSIRIWPCFDTPYQIFTPAINPSGFQIYSPTSDFCLTMDDNHITEINCDQATQWQFFE